MEIYFKDTRNRKITEYKTCRPLIPLMLQIDGDLPTQELQGTITINGNTHVTFNKVPYGTLVYTFATSQDNFYYGFSGGDTDQDLTVEASCKCINAGTETTVTTQLTVQYVKPQYKSPSVLNLVYGVYTQENKDGVHAITAVTHPYPDTSDAETVIQTAIASLSGEDIVPAVGADITRLSQLTTQIIAKYRTPYTENSAGTCADKIYPVNDDPAIPTMISVDSILRGSTATEGGQLVVDALIRGENTLSELSYSNGKLVAVKVILKSAAAETCYQDTIVLRNTVTNNVFRIALWYDPKPAPPVVAVDDAFSLTQGSTLAIAYANLIANDIGNLIYFNRVVPNTAINGIATANNSLSLVEFKSTGLTGERAGFQYEIKNDAGYTSIANVSLVVLRLPDVDGYIFSDAEAEAFMKENSPPTLADVFNTWTRIANGNGYFPPGTTPTGEAAQWAMLNANQFKCTVNSSYLTGFISPKSYLNYTHEVTLTSTDTDDDMIGVILAYLRDGTTNRLLIAERNAGGYYNTTYQWSVVHATLSAANTNSIGDLVVPSANVVKNAALANSFSGKGWSKSGGTRVYVERSDNVFTVKCSKWNSRTYEAGSQIVFDVNANAATKWAAAPCPYGYCCHSQNSSSFSDVVFGGGLQEDTICTVNNKVYKYQNGTWVVSTTETAQSIFGYPRTVTNPNTGKKYNITADGIVEVV